MRPHIKDHLLQAVVAVTAVLLTACASIGNPSGGPRDEDPPRFVRSNPVRGARDFSGDRINIYFNEIVNVKDAFTKVVVSPPSASTPRVSSQGRRVSVEFRDTLLPNTTYTIDFANAIEDNNEGNKLQGFTYTFSTGADIDTLRISGMVLDALTLEPQQGILVGAHTDATDSAFISRRFDRVAKTDDRGRFTLYGLKEIPYRVYALSDMDGDMAYANPEEDLAFMPVTVTPSSERIQVTDTIFNLLNGDVDTVVTRMRTRFLPNDVLLRSFNSGRRQQFIADYSRPDSTRVILRFNTKSSMAPVVSFVGHPADFTTEANATNDTITYWLHQHLSAIDTLRLSVGYHRLDSLSRPVQVFDTLSLITPRQRQNDKVKDDRKDDKIKRKEKGKEADTDTVVVRRPPSELKLTLAGSQQEVYAPITINFSRPVIATDTLAFSIEQRVDTVWQRVAGRPAFTLPDSVSPRSMRIRMPWELGTTYRIIADTLAATDIYGAVSDPWKQEFSIYPENEYSSLTLHLTGVPDSIPAYVDLLDSQEKVVRRAAMESGGTVRMPWLHGGKYYLRMVIDSDRNGEWTPGDFAVGRLPEVSFYYPKTVTVRKNWDAEQDWDVFGTPVDEMKPYTIKKNKPERIKGEPDPSRQQEEDDEAAAEEEARRTGTYNPFANTSGSRSRNNRR